MLDKILIFIMFLGPLVFFHELGHFLFARLFGVKVETFSIGFGPKLFSFKKGDTTYAISLIPLGGYVKMFGDNVLERDNVPEEDRKFAYTHKSIWARFWIVFGGPLANFIMAFVLFFFLFLVGEDAPKAKVGYITSANPIYAEGLRSADTIVEINGKEISNVNDLSALHDSSQNEIVVLRGVTKENISIGLKRDLFIEGLAKSMAYPLRQPLLVDSKGQFFALSRESSKVDWSYSIEEISQSNLELWLIPITSNSVKDEETNTFLDKDIMFNKGVRFDFDGDFNKKLLSDNLYPADLSVKSLAMSSAADKAGVKANDVITHIAGNKLGSFAEMRDLIQKEGASGQILMTILRDGESKELNLTVKKEKEEDLYRIGVYRRIDFVMPKMIQSSPKGFIEAIPLAVKRTWAGMGEVLATFVKLVTAEASMKNLGGPIAIGKYAAASFYSGLTQFFAFMAMMSINLGIINLFPIPVLDGGHIVFLGIELVNRGPLSKKKTEIAYKVGFSILLMMLGVALINDFSSLFRG